MRSTISIWIKYELPLLMISCIIWLSMVLVAEEKIPERFWLIIVFFSLITFFFSLFLKVTERLDLKNFILSLVLGKIFKFLIIMIFAVFMVMYEAVSNYLSTAITIALLWLITLIVDTAQIMNFAKRLINERNDKN
ncbi:MAG: hypothetical protein Q4F97_09600 [Bacteroidales bacterium]|nr:hypothetical protein [Bacteroidales bacterium]